MTFYLKVISAVILVWLMYHLFALFGPLIIIIYLISILLFKNYTPCINCHFHHPQKRCLLCGFKPNPRHTIQSTFSGFKNLSLIIVINILCLILLSIESAILNLLGYPHLPPSASINLPASVNPVLENIIPVPLHLNSPTQSINTIRADLKFDPTVLNAVALSFENSFIEVILKDQIDNNLGYISIIGGLPNPGFQSTQGLIATAYFRVISSGPVELSFLPSSKVLANDGQGTNILKNLDTELYAPSSEADSAPHLTPSELNALLEREADNPDKPLKFEPNPYSFAPIIFPSSPSSPPPSRDASTFQPHPLLQSLSLVDRFILSFYHSFL